MDKLSNENWISIKKVGLPELEIINAEKRIDDFMEYLKL